MMAGNAIDINLDTRHVEKELEKLLNKVERPKKLVNIFSRYINAVTMQMFRGRRPDVGGRRGVKWPRLAKSTVEQKKLLKRKGKLTGGAAPRRPMVTTGAFRDSLKVLEKSDKGLVYGTRIKSKKGFNYPAFHNAGKFPSIFLNKKDLAQGVKMTVDFLSDKLKPFKNYVKKG